MKRSKKHIRASMNLIVYEHFHGRIDDMKEFVYRMGGYALNHPDYLKKMDDPLFAWMDMDSTVFLAEYVQLAYELTNQEPVAKFKGENKEYPHEI